MRIKLLKILFLLPQLFAFSFSFSNIHNPTSSKRIKTKASLLQLSPGDENETPEEQARRMDMVRQLQKSFYQNDDAILPPPEGSTIMKDLPLWRVQWTELPGFQNILNVHVPHYTNMFQKIIHTESNQKYFGHIYLPGGSDNLDNPEYRLEDGSKSTLIGTLMQIADYKQMDDGRFLMIVQAVERFRVVEAQRSHSPYAIASVEILPDEEVIESFYDSSDVDNKSMHVNAVQEAFEIHPYEIKPTTLAECMTDGERESIAVSPLSNYDSAFKRPINAVDNERSNFDSDDPIFETERAVWIQLNKMIHLLQQLVDPKKEQDVPIPTQILGLLPLEPCAPWPEDFFLEKYATKLEIERVLVGTFSKSPFVRADNIEGYSPYRRVQRLSFAIWVLTDTVIALSEEQGGNTRQDILEMASTDERLEAALQKLELICSVIAELLNNQ